MLQCGTLHCVFNLATSNQTTLRAELIVVLE
jgi:hypothetical protein